MPKYTAFIISGALLFSLAFIMISCEKETKCIASIKCTDSTGVALANADVLLFALVKNSAGVTYTADITANGLSDANGDVSFTFELPAIYDIKATLESNSQTLIGNGIIKLEEGKTIQKTIKLK